MELWGIFLILSPFSLTSSKRRSTLNKRDANEINNWIRTHFWDGFWQGVVSRSKIRHQKSGDPPRAK